MSVIDPAAGFPPDTYTMAESYLWMLDRFGGFVAEVMAAIAGALEGGVLVHCAAGKDRTGLVAACSSAWWRSRWRRSRPTTP